MTPSEWSGVVSACAAVVAVGIALWSLRTSRQAFKVALRQERRLQSSLELYLAEAYIRRLRGERRRLYVFRLVITNKADMANSVRSLDLGIQYVHAGKPGPMISVPHSSIVVTSVTDSLEVLAVPSPLPPRGVVAGAAIFDVPDDVLSGIDVESYRVSVSDALGRVTELEAVLLWEHDDGEVEASRRPASE